ncbi:MAG: hypothetical protein JNJ80_07910 [Gemmatimonadetes bacterium]|nr:hypothetical protein [Gemmatimonadota bacterium]MCC7131012.1 hypothetical protein [Gemmatimonadales bacterium]
MSRRLLLVVAALAAFATNAAAQGRRQVPDRERCVIDIVNVDRQGVRTTPTPGQENMYLGGNVHVQCRGRNIHIYADSMASFGGSIWQFISQGNRVKYRDSTTALDTDFGTYVKDGERFEAQGNVEHRDLKTGSMIKGSRVDYLRPVKGLRDVLEVIGYNRPTVTYVVTDSAGRPQAPYVIIGNKVVTKGNEAIYAGGAVQIDREDLKGLADSLWLDSGKSQGGQLIGHASLQSVQENGFTLTGRTIDIGLTNKELSGVTAHDTARLVSKDVTLDADSIRVELVTRRAELTRAWGKTLRPRVVSADYQVTGDSLLILTPLQKLSKVQAFGKGWAGFTGDSSKPGARRDWIGGEIVTVSFVERDSAGVKKTAIQQLEAERDARSFYQMDPERGQTIGSINYTRAQKILVTMRVTRDSNTVSRVDATGAVDGAHLQPALRRRDSTAAKPDSTVRRPEAAPPRRGNR